MNEALGRCHFVAPRLGEALSGTEQSLNGQRTSQVPFFCWLALCSKGLDIQKAHVEIHMRAEIVLWPNA